MRERAPRPPFLPFSIVPSACCLVPICERAEAKPAIARDGRLLYVAMSRAKRKLFLSFAATGSDGQPSARSRFLQELPGEMLHAQMEYSM